MSSHRGPEVRIRNREARFRGGPEGEEVALDPMIAQDIFNAVNILVGDMANTNANVESIGARVGGVVGEGAMAEFRKFLILGILAIAPLSAQTAQMNGNYNVKGSVTRLNGIRFASQFRGSDLGTQINNAVSDCVSASRVCDIYVDELASHTISVLPNLPQGFHLTFSPGTYTLAATWAIQHSDTLYEFNGAQLNYNQDSGAYAILISKNSTGTVNCAGTSTVTYNSGTNFANIDSGDGIYINGIGYNVASVGSKTQLTILGTCPSAPGVAYAAVLGPLQGLGSYATPVQLRDLILNYTGAGTTTSYGIYGVFVSDPILFNVQVSNFTGNQSIGLKFSGVLDAKIYDLKLINNQCQGNLDKGVYGGATVTSNANQFNGGVMKAGGQCTSSNISFNLTNGASNNDFDKWDVEGNAALYTFCTQASSLQNSISNTFFQSNGNGNSSSTDIVFASGTGNVARHNQHVSTTANYPAIGDICTGSGIQCSFEDEIWGASPYTAAYEFTSGATGISKNNYAGSISFVDPPVALPTTGYAKLASLQITDEGSCIMSSGACSAQSLSHTYSAAPKCFANWTGTGTLTGLIKVPSTTTTVTPASSVSTDSAQVNWACFGN